ncbi:extensin-like [Pecten maximus]|uniref:extensin-like n=1 Tax=Pecten maximus TaxID=6579 RepID=UPI001458CEBA|nr:extensin-like [Pecten maximus]
MALLRLQNSHRATPHIPQPPPRNSPDPYHTLIHKYTPILANNASQLFTRGPVAPTQLQSGHSPHNIHYAPRKDHRHPPPPKPPSLPSTPSSLPTHSTASTTHLSSHARSPQVHLATPPHTSPTLHQRIQQAPASAPDREQSHATTPRPPPPHAPPQPRITPSTAHRLDTLWATPPPAPRSLRARAPGQSNRPPPSQQKIPHNYPIPPKSAHNPQKNCPRTHKIPPPPKRTLPESTSILPHIQNTITPRTHQSQNPTPGPTTIGPPAINSRDRPGPTTKALPK